MDLSQLCRDTAEALSEAEPGRHVDLTVEEGLVVQGDRALLSTVMQNLLENAWKFTANGDGGCVECGRAETDGETRYHVQDNGAGFDMAYANKLFAPFQRLHARDEFEGTGIGLATVQRIIHRHGGRIWAESAPGEGATFYFTLGEHSA